MKNKLAVLSGTILGFIIASLVIITPVYAINPPDTITINAVYGYQHCLELNDQLYIMEFNIGYTAIPTDYNLNQAYLFRLMNGTTELKSVAPYYFSLHPWGQQVVAIYFSASTAPLWSNNYTAQLIGNPTVSWNGTIPTRTSGVTKSSSTSMAITHTELALRILQLAQQLETSWSIAGLTMIQNIAGGQALSTTGESYFVNIISGLKLMAPTAFSSTSISPVFIKPVTPPNTYASNISSMVTGTPFDLTSLANALGITRVPLTVLIFAGIMLLLSGAWTRGAKSSKPLLLLLVPAVEAGVFMAGLPMWLCIGIGLFAMVAVIYFITYQKASV
jgi:hypothetical protein